jgi:hypothetical protein
LDNTYLILVSDHGFTATSSEHWIDPTAWLKGQHGLKVHEGLYIDERYYERAEYFSKIDAVVARDCRKASIHLRGPAGWHDPADAKLLNLLLHPLPPDATEDDWPIWRLNGLALVAYKAEPDSVHIVNRQGLATIRRVRTGQKHAYTYANNHGDPLGYMADVKLAGFLAAGPHTSREWLEATANADIPDFVGQIVELFDSPRSGDIVLFAQRGWDFAPKDVAGHGSIFADEMGVSMVFAGPGIAAGRSIEYARTTDVMPTIVELLGAGERLRDIEGLDGVSLAPRLGARSGVATR